MDEREHRIRERAHRLWEEEGRPQGRAEHHWHAAREIIALEDAQAQTLKPIDSGVDTVEPIEALTNAGEFPTLTDQGEMQPPQKPKPVKEKPAKEKPVKEKPVKQQPAAKAETDKPAKNPAPPAQVKAEAPKKADATKKTEAPKKAEEPKKADAPKKSEAAKKSAARPAAAPAAKKPASAKKTPA